MEPPPDPSSSSPPVVRTRFRVRGTVQGVGFRPAVAVQASTGDLAGWVANDGADVVGEVEGPPEPVRAFLDALAAAPPPLARVEEVTTRSVPAEGGSGFAIAASRPAPGALVGIPADRAPCPACRDEVRDRADRRAGHPFASCTGCGPRLSIVTGAPFDRARTTMAGLPLCSACRAEHDDPADRRFHAQTICCPDCGPRLRVAPDPPQGRDPIAHVADVLGRGGVALVKGVGGFHLACRADDEAAVQRVRRLKRRPHRPLAVLVADPEDAGAIGVLDDPARRALTDQRAPIVLLERATPTTLAPGVAPGTDLVGVLLPPSPLHDLLARAARTPLVLTSANVSGEPMVVDDAEAEARFGADVDVTVGHDRAIATRVDDSVVRVLAGAARPLRRARGWAPEPVVLGRPVPVPVLALGAGLKATVCLAVGDRAHLSTHIGDLTHPACVDAHRSVAEALVAAVAPEVEVVAHDLHPGYPSTELARSWPGARAVGVQHHHAHVAACLAEHGHPGPVVGVAFDGIGWGPDGTAWGGEILLADRRGYERLGHLDPVPMPGSTAAIGEPWRMACAHLERAGVIDAGGALAARHGRAWDDVVVLVRRGVRAPLTSSVGRLCEAVAVLCGGPDRSTFEAQAAVALEALARPAWRAADPGHGVALVERDGAVVLDAGAMVRAVVADLAAGTAPSVVAARFHAGLAATTAEAVRRITEVTGVAAVALVGGSFQNALLVEGVRSRLVAAGCDVLIPTQVPVNDAAISLGQAVVAAEISGEAARH